jgi:hypothetical protein
LVRLSPGGWIKDHVPGVIVVTSNGIQFAGEVIVKFAVRSSAVEGAGIRVSDASMPLTAAPPRRP